MARLIEATAFQIYPYDGSHAPTPTRPPSPQSSLHVQPSPQESGVIGSGNMTYGHNFGPATREHYEASQWALTVPDPSTVEIIPDVDIYERIRQSGEPVVMRPTPDRDPLAPFISIIGHVPLARKVLIEMGEPLDDYGRDGTWWSGTPITRPEISDGESSSAEADKAALVYETQRLMVFMFHSTRLYGSVEPLVQGKLLQNLESIEDFKANTELSVVNNVDKFTAALSYAAKGVPNGEQAAQLFEGSVVYGNREISFYQLDVVINSETNGEPKDLYDAIDGMIWANDRNGEHKDDFYLVKLPPILVMHIRNMDGRMRDLGVDIPPALYIDRYTEKYKDRVKQMRKDIAECRRLVQSLDEEIKSLSFIRTDESMKCSSTQLIESAMEYLERDFPPPDAGSESAMWMEDDDTEAEVEIDMTESKELASKLELVYHRLRAKLEGPYFSVDRAISNTLNGR
jgi:hypothetical protein